jgi:arginine/lysine/ornithine decarboxylase
MRRTLVVTLALLSVLCVLESRVILDQRARLRAFEKDARGLAASQLSDHHEDLVRAGRWLHEYYASDRGLVRASGLVQDGEPDFEGISAWLVQTYLRHRIQGASETAARTAVVEAIERTPDWQALHRPKWPHP